MKPFPEERPIREQVWAAFDPTGSTRSLVEAAMDSPSTSRWTALLDSDLASSWATLQSLGREYGDLVGNIEAAFQHLVPRGWAVTMTQSAVVKTATELARSGKGDDADALLTDQWFDEGAWRTKRVCDRVRVMGAGDTELHDLFLQRARLLARAREHHDLGRYEASIPLLQAQIEGIVIDVSDGRKFFTKGPEQADLVDPAQLVSIEAGLADLRATQGQDVRTTQAIGSLSRHGIAHGRELAYDTRINSAKTWSVLDAVVEWALPKARFVVESRKAERWAANAGSRALDEKGRRIDDREFAVTRDLLRLLSTSALGWHRQRGTWRQIFLAVSTRTRTSRSEGSTAAAEPPSESAPTGRRSRTGE